MQHAACNGSESLPRNLIATSTFPLRDAAAHGGAQPRPSGVSERKTFIQNVARGRPKKEERIKPKRCNGTQLASESEWWRIRIGGGGGDDGGETQRVETTLSWLRARAPLCKARSYQHGQKTAATAFSGPLCQLGRGYRGRQRWTIAAASVSRSLAMWPAQLNNFHKSLPNGWGTEAAGFCPGDMGGRRTPLVASPFFGGGAWEHGTGPTTLDGVAHTPNLCPQGPPAGPLEEGRSLRSVQPFKLHADRGGVGARTNPCSGTTWPRLRARACTLCGAGKVDLYAKGFQMGSGTETPPLSKKMTGSFLLLQRRSS